MKSSKILKNIYLLIGLIIIYTSLYLKNAFDNISFEQLLFTIQTSKGTSITAVAEGTVFVTIATLISYVLIMTINKKIKTLKHKLNLIIKIDKLKLQLRLFPPTKKQKKLLFILFIIISILFSVYNLKVFDYIESQTNISTIFEKHYIDPKDIEIEFPDKKRNLIYIFVESLEMTNTSIENGGAMQKSYIPNLEKIAIENINFSNTSKLGGAYTTTNSSWTIAGLISQTAGIPLKTPVSKEEYLNYSEFLPGVYNLGEILEDNGYKNYIMMGSDATFGSRRDYFEYHGNYEIFDHHWAIENNLIDEDYQVWWGYEDKKLYKFAKEELKTIAKEDEPFNFTILTADTHFTDGYLEKDSEKPFDQKYANVFYQADNMLNEFLNWIKKQDFYENTTIIISGDHKTMQSNFYKDTVHENYDRVVYNTIINSEIKPIQEKNRIFTTLDMFPTTLASLGATIEGERLGLGTNLYSSKKTLAEEITFEKLDKELIKKSNFYNYNLLKNNYFEMKKKTKNQ